jgi:class 3 adenylate cyclase
VPTLLVAHPDDVVIPIELVRETAADIRGARLVETDTPGHWSWDIAERADLDVIEAFLTSSDGADPPTGEAPPRPDRVLATVLYTDIVASTERLVTLGDHRWRALLDMHDAATRRELERDRGRELATTGDGFVAAFDGPARAVRCAQAIVRETSVLGLQIRAGVHAGECEVRGEELAGITMHVGARVAALAGAGEVLVSRTVCDLVGGSDIEFDPRGEHALKGIPERWQLFAARP